MTYSFGHNCITFLRDRAKHWHIGGLFNSHLDTSLNHVHLFFNPYPHDMLLILGDQHREDRLVSNR
jgi:hypothetical protein